MTKAHTNETDFAVVGCGIAGLRAAIELAGAGAKVEVLAKAELTESNTQYAQGGIAAALSDEDEIVLHIQDTLAAGDGLCNPDAVRILVEEGPEYIQQLIRWGTEFDRNGTSLAFTREGAHSRSRVLHAHGDSTGREISRALVARARSLASLRLLPFTFTIDLIQEGGRITGIRYLDEQSGDVRELRCRAVLLATGGLGQIYSETTNPTVATGDGVAIAYRAGAALSDMEFVQFHPTALSVESAPRFLLSEALRGEGGVLRNLELDRFMPGYSAEGELAPRDVVSRAIMTEMRKAGGPFVYLDMSALAPDKIRARFPRIHRTCLEYNLDITNQLIPVSPAAHYSMGGVATDMDGFTSLEGLYAAGEVACTGVHGANRLASNSLLEGLVFGARAGKAMAAQEGFTGTGATAKKSGKNSAPSGQPPRKTIPAGILTEAEQIRKTMWASAGIIRTGTKLQQGLAELNRWERPLPPEAERAHYETANQLLVGGVILRSALAREESRGAHYREDHPFHGGPEALHSIVVREKEVEFVPDPGRVSGRTASAQAV